MQISSINCEAYFTELAKKVIVLLWTLGSSCGKAGASRTSKISGRRTKNNPCLIGSPGVGETTIVEGLAQRISSRQVPEILDVKVISLDIPRIISGTIYRREFEERLKQLMDEVKQSDDIILFIDEVCMLIGAGVVKDSAINAANILKPALARGELKVMVPRHLMSTETWRKIQLRRMISACESSWTIR
nr:chaperone protein clpc, chloroplastic [Quercus suber]